MDANKQITPPGSSCLKVLTPPNPKAAHKIAVSLISISIVSISMDAMELFERLESAWFFSNVLSTKHEPAEPITKDTPVIRNPPPTNPQPGILIRRAVEGPNPMGSEPVLDLSMSPRRREEDERRRLRRRQRTMSYGGGYGGVCRGNLEAAIEFCGGGELKRLKDERAMKRQLKTWAVAVAVASASASSPAQTRPLVALCC